MAYIGTVALTAQDGSLRGSWRYASPACDGPGLVLRRMLGDVRKVLRRKPEPSLAVVQDGAGVLWNLTRAALATLKLKRPYLQAMDFYHATQHVHAALSMCEEDTRVRKDFSVDGTGTCSPSRWA